MSHPTDCRCFACIPPGTSRASTEARQRERYRRHALKLCLSCDAPVHGKQWRCSACKRALPFRIGRLPASWLDV